MWRKNSPVLTCAFCLAMTMPAAVEAAGALLEGEHVIELRGTGGDNPWLNITGTGVVLGGDNDSDSPSRLLIVKHSASPSANKEPGAQIFSDDLVIIRGLAGDPPHGNAWISVPSSVGQEVVSSSDVNRASALKIERIDPATDSPMPTGTSISRGDTVTLRDTASAGNYPLELASKNKPLITLANPVIGTRFVLENIIPLAAPAASDVVVVPVIISVGTNPQSFEELVASCAKNNACSAALTTAAALVGVSPDQVTPVLAGLQTINQSTAEDAYHGVSPPEGYNFCRIIDYTLLLHNPTNGPRTPFIAARLNDSLAFGVYTWVPKRHFSEGRAWVEARFDIMAMKRDKFLSWNKTPGNCDLREGGPNHIDCRTPNQGPKCTL